MKSNSVAVFAVVGVALVAAAVVAVKYEDWFITPKLIQAKRGYVVQQMRDPAAVQFQGERLTQGGWLCGELNGKNGYGAYTGFKRFMSFGYDDAWIEGTGYAGKSNAQGTAKIIEGLDEQNKILGEYLDAIKASNLPKPSRQEIDEHVEKQMFARRWAKNCT